MDYLQDQILQDSGILQNMNTVEEHTIRKITDSKRSVSGIITIPVVVHIVYKNTTENVSDAQIATQIQVLTEDFRRMNADKDNTWPQAADIQLEFCLASLDPNGNPTTGITRTSTTNNSFSHFSDAVKSAASGGKDGWPRAEYLNFWVCDLSGSTLGYAQFPGGGPASEDGIVVDFESFGTVGTAEPPFHLGRTATHEVGHWLNLRHIWGDGNCSKDDLVTDTPNASGANRTGSPCSFPGPNSCDEGAGDQPDMFQNYMDYSDDLCLNLFTQGQKERMRTLFEPGGFRRSLLYSDGCGTYIPTCSDGQMNGNEIGIDCGGPDCGPCDPCTDIVIQIELDNDPEETSWEIRNSNQEIVFLGGWYSDLPNGSTITENICLPAGCYTFKISDSGGDGICCQSGGGSYSVSASGTILASGGSFGSQQTTPFCLVSSYTFIGPGQDWNTISNWQGSSKPPHPCSETISIISDCIRSGLGELDVQGPFNVDAGVIFLQE
ncbi:UNVERIFIED_CONTAM: hypothetical protein GTU68_066201 [Idotea baltica]|nr:hypothetical protein [Idotea baltica]